MTRNSLNRVLAAIEDGRSKDVLGKLASLRYKHSRDAAICFVYAHAQEQVGQSDRAVSTWKCAGKLQGKKAVIGGPAGPTGTPFRFTPDLEEKLEVILAKDYGDSAIDTLTDLLNDPNPITSLTTDEPNWQDDTLPEEEELTVVSETLGRILVAQAKYGKAAMVYRSLADGNPDRRDDLLAEAARFQRMADAHSVP